MAKAMAFIDGFNLYHALKHEDHEEKQPYAAYRWIDYRKLSECFLPPANVLSDVFLLHGICFMGQHFRK